MYGLFILFLFMPTLNPILNDKIHVKRPIHVTLTYPYYYALRYALMKDYTMLKLPFPTCPLLFMYGSNKGAHFHGPKFIEKIKGTVGDKYIGKVYIYHVLLVYIYYYVSMMYVYCKHIYIRVYTYVYMPLYVYRLSFPHSSMPNDCTIPK